MWTADISRISRSACISSGIRSASPADGERRQVALRRRIRHWYSGYRRTDGDSGIECGWVETARCCARWWEAVEVPVRWRVRGVVRSTPEGCRVTNGYHAISRRDVGLVTGYKILINKVYEKYSVLKLEHKQWAHYPRGILFTIFSFAYLSHPIIIAIV